MLKVRTRQRESLAVRSFVDATTKHLDRYFPKHRAHLGTDRLEAFVRLGLARARAHGLFAERGARLYIDLMCLLGSGFDADPQLPWARAILEDPTIGDEATRIDFLYARAGEHIDRIADDHRALLGDPDRARFFEEVRAVQREPNAPLTPAEAPALAAHIADRLRAAFPNKARVLGPAGVLGVAERGIAAAHRHRLGTARGAFVCSALMFVAGTHFDVEPQLPWVTELLARPDPANPGERVDLLVDALVQLLRTWLA